MVPRTVAVLKAFRASREALGVSAVEQKTGLPRATVHRTLNELAKTGLLERSGTSYRPGLLLFELGNMPSDVQQMRTLARPHMTSLRLTTGLNVTLAVLDGLDCVYLEILRAAEHRRLPQRVGGRWPAHACCSGKALLAFDPQARSLLASTAVLRPLTSRTMTAHEAVEKELDEIRVRGAAFDREESVPGLTGVAAPIRNSQGRVVAALAVSGPARQVNLPGVENGVRAVAGIISRRLAGQAAVSR
jgi:IclR family acetate operon transcriptional repressor